MGGKSNSLLAGDHTRVVSVVAPVTGAMMKFAIKKTTCLGCKTSMKGEFSNLNI
jgi:DNA polymerase delta subunit 1